MSDSATPQALKILVAEDEPVSRVLMSGILRRLGFQADYVLNGLEAVSAVHQRDYDVILMDIQMPEMDGFSAAREILKSRPDATRPVIIAVTAVENDGIREQCLQAGMNDYMHKPVDEDEVKQVLAKWGRPVIRATSVSQEGNQNPSNDVAKRLDLLKRETDASFVKELIDIFLNSTPRHLASMRQALERADGQALQAAAHGLKGGSANFGALYLASLCQHLENLGESGQLEGARPLLGDLEQEFEKVCSELRTYKEAM